MQFHHIPNEARMGEPHWVQLSDGNRMKVYQLVDGTRWVQRSTVYEQIDDWWVNSGKAIFVIGGKKYEYPITDHGTGESNNE